MKRKLALVKSSSLPAKPGAKGLLTDVREMILKAREGVARTVDASVTLHYWEVGRRIRQDILKEKRAEYGAEIVVTLSRQLGWSHLAALRDDDRLSPELVFRDPYFLDFLGLKDTYSEKDVEAAILREMEAFILELGVGFAFVARQKRMQIDDRDYYLDLLFYHRKLRRLVAIEDWRLRGGGQGSDGTLPELAEMLRIRAGRSRADWNDSVRR